MRCTSSPQSQIMALPRGATAVDFAFAIHSNVGSHTAGARINNEQVPLRTELKNGDVVEIITDPPPRPTPLAGLCARTGRADPRSATTSRHWPRPNLKTWAKKLLTQALRSGCSNAVPGRGHQQIWERLLRFTGNRARSELLTDIGLGKRIASTSPNDWWCWDDRTRPANPMRY